MPMKDFNLIRQEETSRILVAAHRGACGGNIPCNTMTAFETALRQGADILEMDVERAADGTLFIFHEGKEKPHLNDFEHSLKLMTADEIKQLRYVNQDHDVTQFPINTLDEVLEAFKGRCYINLDHCWHFFPEAVAAVRRHKMEEQIILKSAPKQKFFDIIAEVAPDIAYMPILKNDDHCFDILNNMKINFAGAEVVFDSLDAEIASLDYIEKMHKAGKKLWANAIIYRHTVQLAAGMSDDTSLMEEPSKGWGALADRNYDIIQTDWTGLMCDYLYKTGQIYKN